MLRSLHTTPRVLLAALALLGARAATPVTRVNPRDGLTYVWIPPGDFIMGCSPGDDLCSAEEKPAHRVTITKGFWIGQTSVTQGAYVRVTGHNPSKFRGAKHPVESLSWDKAQAYCQATGMRLPTEAEWEYAARAGSTGRHYAPLDQIAWYVGSSPDTTREVGTKHPNAWQLYDMLGNVWQWTADWYDPDYYSRGEAQDPHGPSSGIRRVARGASRDNNFTFVRVSRRYTFIPFGLYFDIGVRCAGD